MLSGALGEGCACGWELPFLLILGPSCAEVFLSYIVCRCQVAQRTLTRNDSASYLLLDMSTALRLE